MLYITINSNPGKEEKIKKVLAGPIYIQNPVNGRFRPNLDFRKAGSRTARNFKFCVKHDWWSTRPPSKFQVKIIFLGWDMGHWNLRLTKKLRHMHHTLPKTKKFGCVGGETWLLFSFQKLRDRQKSGETGQVTWEITSVLRVDSRTAKIMP